MPHVSLLKFVTAALIFPMTLLACRQNSASTLPESSSAVQPASSSAQNDPIRITSPNEGDTVPERPFVEVAVPVPVTDVWVIVHPMAVSDYWVQPKPSNRGGGQWKTQIFVGQPGSQNEGQHFEIKAVADPGQPLHQGQKLTDWPKAKLQSAIVEVVRGK